ncbi:MAG: hypothetical protein ACRDZW_05590 [Acidimicrobiales bacterium]
MAVIEAPGAPEGTDRPDGRLALAYEAVVHRLEGLGWLRQALAVPDPAVRTGALRAVAGLHRAALRQSVIAVFGSDGVDGLGRPRLDLLPPPVEAALLGYLAGQVGVPAHEVRHAGVNRTAFGS